jgi:hypothetical protein
MSVVLVCIAFGKKMKIQKALCTGGMEIPLREHLVETVCTQ